MGGHHAIAQVLLMYGADPFAKDSEQSTPLDDAAANGHDHIIAQMQMRLPEIRLPSVPDPPRLQLSTVDMLEVRWDPPADDEPDGPRRVEAYGLQLARIEGGRMPSGEAAWRTVGRRVASRHCRIRGLRPGHAFVTRVAASNKFGWGRWSEASEVMWTLTAEEAAAAGGSSVGGGRSGAKATPQPQPQPQPQPAPSAPAPTGEPAGVQPPRGRSGRAGRARAPSPPSPADSWEDADERGRAGAARKTSDGASDNDDDDDDEEEGGGASAAASSPTRRPLSPLQARPAPPADRVDALDSTGFMMAAAGGGPPSLPRHRLPSHQSHSRPLSADRHGAAGIRAGAPPTPGTLSGALGAMGGVMFPSALRHASPAPALATAQGGKIRRGGSGVGAPFARTGSGMRPLSAAATDSAVGVSAPGADAAAGLGLGAAASASPRSAGVGAGRGSGSGSGSGSGGGSGSGSRNTGKGTGSGEGTGGGFWARRVQGEGGALSGLQAGWSGGGQAGGDRSRGGGGGTGGRGRDSGKGSGAGRKPRAPRKPQAQDGGSSAPSAGSNGARAARGAGSSSSSSSSASLLSSAPKAAPAAAAASPAENSTDAEVAAEPPSSGLFWGRSQRSMRPSTSAGQHSASEVGAGDVGEDSGHSWSGAGAADAGSVESGRRAVDTGGRQTGWTRGGGPGDVRQRARAEAARTASGAGAGAGAGAGTASPRDDIRTPLLEREFASTLQSLREALREANEERRLAETKAASLELQLRKSGRRADAADDRLKVYRADRRALRSLDMDVLTALETELERAIAGVRAEKNDRVRKVLAGQDDVD